ncbi:furan-3-one reductase [Seminavis robusta]|uniref:Furan-3-one reductase n=1 Tax=Seminavis robusta TaxID=568900 RepID=A0A9N8DBZ1_9STRA|nr:furan-3-one reductase [Seminavis robusta]|eukprot:Sro29_g019120.1 furan-3-one reductase (378) ;mRNA; r:68925-70058
MPRGLGYRRYGRPSDILEFIHYESIPHPLKADDVVIQIHAGAVNPADYKHMSGALRPLVSRPLPIFPCWDFCGQVIELGRTAQAHQKFHVGDMVYGMSAGLRHGTLNEYHVVDERCLALKPSTMSCEEAAGVPLAALTALQAWEEGGLRQISRPVKDRRVFLTGGPGGVGTFAIQIAKHMFGCAEIWTTASTEAKIALCQELGATRVIHYKQEDWTKVLPKNYFDVMLDLTGEAYKMFPFAKSSDTATNTRGAVISISSGPTGNILGRWLDNLPDMTYAGAPKVYPVAATFIKMLPCLVDVFTGGLFYKGCGYRRGVFFNHVITMALGSDLERLTVLIEAGKIKCVIDQVYDFDHAKDAILHVESGRAVGKVVVKIV